MRRHIKQILHVIVLWSYSRPPFWFPVRMWWYWEKQQNVPTFYLVHTTLPNYNHVTRISANTFGWNFITSYEVNRKFKRFLLLSFIPPCAKGNKEVLPNCARIGGYRVVQTLFDGPMMLYLVPMYKSWNPYPYQPKQFQTMTCHIRENC